MHNASDSAGHASLEFSPEDKSVLAPACDNPIASDLPGILEGNNPIAGDLDAIAYDLAGDTAIASHLTPENICIAAKNASVYNSIPDLAHHNAGAISTSHSNQQHDGIQQRKSRDLFIAEPSFPTLVYQHMGERELIFGWGTILAQSMQPRGIMHPPSTGVINIVMCWHSC